MGCISKRTRLRQTRWGRKTVHQEKSVAESPSWNTTVPCGTLSLNGRARNNLLGNALIGQFGKIPEAEPVVIVRISDQRQALTTRCFQPGQAFVDLRFADSLLLTFRQDGNRPQALPAGCFV
jgi:hypothetical protein